jgi:xylulokinase
VAYGLKDSFDILAEMGVPLQQVRASGGGARSPLWRQIQADVTGREHVCINVDEGPAFGVALLAGVGTGVWPDVATACRETIQVTDRCAPDPVRAELYGRYHPVYQRLYASLKDSFAEVTALSA